VQLYDKEITTILDQLIPMRTVRFRRHASDAWFDDDCCVAKCCVRQFECDVRRIRRADPQNTTAIDAGIAIWTKRRREYRHMLRTKREKFWLAKVASESSSPRLLWRSIDVLLGGGCIPSSLSVTADAVHAFFDAKVVGVRSSTNDAPPPVFTAAPPGCSLMEFQQLSVDDVVAAVRQLPDKQCASDPLPTSLLKENVDVLAPFFTELFNRSLILGAVPTIFKSAHITPFIKKSDLDPGEPKSYRPISNLSVLLKMLERLVALQLLDYLSAADLLPNVQSAYRAHHSRETAVLKVLGDILRAVDSGDLAALARLVCCIRYRRSCNIAAATADIV